MRVQQCQHFYIGLYIFSIMDDFKERSSEYVFTYIRYSILIMYSICVQ